MHILATKASSELRGSEAKRLCGWAATGSAAVLTEYPGGDIP